MIDIAKRLKAYIEAHPFNPGDSDCETVLDQLYQAYVESHESDPPEIKQGFKELDELLGSYRWLITMPCSISVVAYVAPTNAKLLLTV